MEPTAIAVPAASVAPASAATSRVQVNVHVQAEIVSPAAARRQANAWLLENVGNLLRAESPELVLRDRLAWRVDVMLTSPTRGTIGRVGQLELDAVTGQVLADESIAQELCAHARTLAGD